LARGRQVDGRDAVQTVEHLCAYSLYWIRCGIDSQCRTSRPR